MAKQKGVIKLKGLIEDLSFYQTIDGYLARKNNPITAERIATDPAFRRTRENGAEFSRAGKATRVFRVAFESLAKNVKDSRLTGRLTAAMMKVIKADTTSKRGLRNVIDGDVELLKGFNFNIHAQLNTTISAPYAATINRVTGSLTVSIPSFIPEESITIPVGATHFKIVSMGAEVDFENESSVTDQSESGILPWDTAATAVITLANTVTPASTKPLFLLLGIQFYQHVNGENYPLQNNAFNALSLVMVEG
jgi:hypothetical protein